MIEEKKFKKMFHIEIHHSSTCNPTVSLILLIIVGISYHNLLFKVYEIKPHDIRNSWSRKDDEAQKYVF